MNQSNKLLSDITAFRTYAKYLQHAGRREVLEETINRDMNMFLNRYPKLSAEITRAFSLVHDLKVMPSMRSLQFSGEAVLKNNARIFNCSFLNIDSPRAFGEALFLLLSGVGVGYSVQRRHTNQLPVIRPPTEEGKFLVHDSIQGWAQSIDALMEAYFFGRIRPVFDFSQVRPKGSYLVTTGAKAPGPEPLRAMLIQVEGKLKAALGRRMRPLEVHDIVCLISDCVLAGGIRRAALISLFDKDDSEMMNCKKGSWWETAPWRARANNSAVLTRGEVTKDEFMDILKACQDSGAGEPGFSWTNDADNMGFNPCHEIALNSRQFCVSGDTPLITRDGITPIQKLVGAQTEIWNGEEWSSVKPFKTGTGALLYRVEFSDGSFLDATGYHKFLAKKDYEQEFREFTTLELKELVESYESTVQIPRANINGETVSGTSDKNAFEYGFFLGDGHVDHKLLKANLYNEDKNISLNGRLFEKTHTNWCGTEYKTIEFTSLNRELSYALKAEHGIPEYFKGLDYKSTLDFFAGWIDADGSQANLGCRLYGKESKLRDAQVMLTRVGIDSSLHLMQEAGTETNLGVRKNAVWYLQIPNASRIPSRRFNLKDGKNPPYKGKYQTVKKITLLEGEHDTFCLTEPKLNQCVFGNVLTKQCNLSTINVTGANTEKEFLRRVHAATLIGTLQASFTDFPYLTPKWKENTEKEALLGVSMTGVADAGDFLTPELLEKGAKLVLEVNEKIARKIGINPAARATAIKPEGTSSCVLGSSSGIHDRHDEYYIRRIRMNKDDALYKYLMSVIPDLCEDDMFSPTGGVVSIPQESPKTAIIRSSTSAIDLLERAIKFNKHWVANGHRSGKNMHNVSTTISVRDGEWRELGGQMWKYRDSYTGISLLPYDGGSYVQAPFESCSKERYEELSKLVRTIDLRNVMELDDYTNRVEQLACVGGTCSLE